MSYLEIINLSHLCTELAPIVFRAIVGLEDNNLSRIALRDILSGGSFNHPVNVLSSEGCWEGITKYEKHAADHFFECAPRCVFQAR